MMLRNLQANIAYRFGWTKLSYPPLLISLEPTNYCNLRCPMCPVGHHAKDPSVARGFMPVDVFDELLPELQRLSPIVAFHMGGESILHPQFHEMGRRLRAAGIFVRLDSNAMLLNEDVAELLISDPPVDEIYLDLDGEDSESYEAIRRRARFDRVTKNIAHFLRVRRDRAATVPKVIVKGIRYYTPSAKPGFPECYKALFADAPPDEYRFAWADYWPGTHGEDVANSTQNDQFEAPPAPESPKACQLLWSRLAIAWDGQALLCCLDLNRTHIVADVKKVGIMGAWNSEAMQDARRRHTQGKQTRMSLCRNCLQIRREPSALARWLPFLKVDRSLDQGGERKS